MSSGFGIGSSGNDYNPDIGFKKSPQIDAFGRLRVSQVTTQFDAKQIHDNLPLFIDDEIIGSATNVYSSVDAQSTLGTSANADAVILQTKQRFNYQSGKSQLLFWTFNGMGNETNVIKRIGYFSSNTVSPFESNLDGFFLENDGTTMRVKVYRTGVLMDDKPRNEWTDPLDGTGVSGVSHDFADNTIVVCSFEWLGVGEIQYGIVKDGVIIPFLYLDHTNLAGVYMSSPNQPMRWELRQIGVGQGSMNVICSSVSSEGSINQLGKILSENIGVDFINANLTTLKYALLGITLQVSRANTLIDLLDFSVLSITADNLLIEVWLNPTVAGVFTYNNIANSSCSIAKGLAGGSNTVTGGTLLFSRYVSQQSATPILIENAIRLGMTIAGVTDKIVITAQPLTANADVFGSITWRELA
jgi:hypothetical protein